MNTLIDFITFVLAWIGFGFLLVLASAALRDRWGR